jgi:hypothetical protein
MDRIFLFGDSFTFNLYERARGVKEPGVSERPILKYMDLLTKELNPDPLHFSDYLKKFGYDVYNYGGNGISIYSIIYYFKALADFKFKEGDRIIVNLTSFSRFDLIDDKGENHTAVCENVGDWTEDLTIKKFIVDQRLNRLYSLDNRGYIGWELLNFLKYFLDLHKEYRPILWSPFPENIKPFEDCKWFVRDISDPIFKSICPEHDKIRIWDETHNLIYDEHYSRYGNYYNAHIFKSVLESGLDGFYLSDEDLNSKIFDIVSKESGFTPIKERAINRFRNLI